MIKNKIKNKIKNLIIKFWYSRSRWVLGAAFLLSPLSAVYCLAVKLKIFFNPPIVSSIRSVPCVVVGNLTVGGTGKTPMVIYLVKLCQELGLKPGVISRGYGSHATDYPLEITPTISVKNAGDEPFLIFKKTGVPVFISPNRVQAREGLLKKHPEVNILISDDGLSHTALPRDIEIIMVDGLRKFGNGHCLPIGPLRENLSRLKHADFLIQTDVDMTLKPVRVVSLKNPGVSFNLSDWLNDSAVRAVNLISGIGNPARFENTVRSLGLQIQEHHIFPDHYEFSVKDLRSQEPRYPILMTEKDAVKCCDLDFENLNLNLWFLEIEASFSSDFENNFKANFFKKIRGSLF